MLTCKEIMEYRNKYNLFPRMLGIRTTLLEPGHACAEMKICSTYENAIGSVHGGCIFSLADTVAGSAAASNGMKMTTLGSNLNYLKAAMHVDSLYGEATEVKSGKNIAIYNVEIKDSKNNMIANGSFSFFNLKEELIAHTEK